MSELPLARALILIGILGLAGLAHCAWLASRWSRRFAKPLDGGRSWRGRRLLGEHKTWRGLMVLPPAAALAGAGVAALRDQLPPWLAGGLWPMTVLDHALLGFLAGLAFLLAELPNSFVKRRLGVPDGGRPAQRGWALLTGLVDRVDSALGVLLAVSLCVAVPWATWAWVLLIGTVVHAGFSALLYALRVKGRAL